MPSQTETISQGVNFFFISWTFCVYHLIFVCSIHTPGMLQLVQLSTNCRIGCWSNDKYFVHSWNNLAYNWMNTAHSVPSPCPSLKIWQGTKFSIIIAQIVNALNKTGLAHATFNHGRGHRGLVGLFTIHSAKGRGIESRSFFFFYSFPNQSREEAFSS